MILHRAHLLSSAGPQRLWEVVDGGLLVDNGRILGAGPFEALRTQHPGAAVQDLRPLWILPGLVDAHTHLPQLGAVAEDGLELLPWLERFIFPAEEAFADVKHAARAAKAFFAEALSWGTTTVVAYGTIHAEATDAAFQAAERCGIRAVLGQVLMDRHAPPALTQDTEGALAESESLIRAWQGRDHGRLGYALSPRYAPVCSPALMRGAARLMDHYGVHLQTHLAENPDEIAWVARLFPEAASYTDVYRRHGLLGPRTLLGHGIHLSPAERELIRDSGAVIVNCPSSNAFLKSGVMPTRRWREEGLKLALGTDVGAGPELSMWREMAAACTVSKLRSALLQEQETAVGPVEAFWLATLGGAEALGFAERIGSLEPGKDADFILVDPAVVDPTLPDPNAPRESTAEEVLSRLIYRAERSMVKGAWVQGRKCH